MTRNGKLSIGLIALILIWVVMLVFNWDRIESEIATDSSAALTGAGYNDLRVDTENRGRTVHLSGVVRSPLDVGKVTSIVKEVEGVHRVTGGGIQVRPYSPARFSLSRNGGAMTLLGAMSSGGAAKQLTKQISQAMKLPVDHGLSIDPDVESPQWLVGLATGMPNLSSVENLQISIGDNALQIAGVSREQGQYQAALDAVSNLQGIDEVDSSGLILQPLKPSWFELSSGALTAKVGSASSARQLQGLLGGFVADGGQALVEVDKEYAYTAWIDDLALVAGNAAGVESPSISYREGVMRVAGVVRTQAEFDALAQQAPELTETRQLNLSELVLRPFSAPWIALQTAEEKILLEGVVNNEEAAALLLNQVVDATGADYSGIVENQLIADGDTAPADWSNSMGGLIAGMAKVEDGSLRLQDDVLLVSGIVRSEDVFSQLRGDASGSDVAETVDTSNLALRPFKAPRFALSTFAKKVVASGRVGDNDSAALLSKAIGLVFGANDFTQVLVDPDVTGAGWINDVMRLMPAMTGLENASLTATDESIDLAGIARTQESYELLAKSVDESATAVTNTVALRPWQQPSLEIVSAADQLIATGTMANQASVQKIDAQITALGVAAKLPAVSSLDANIDVQNTVWVERIVDAIPALAALDQPGLRIREGAMTVSGRVGDVASMELVVEKMSAAAGDLAVQNDIIVIPPLVIESGAGSSGVPQISADAQPLQSGQVAIAYPDIAQEAIARCERSLDALMASRTIEFATSSAVLSESSTPVMLALIEALKKCPDVVIEVSGHTDNTGNNANNLVLSDERAQAVVDYLVTAGIPTARLQAEGYGSAQPVADNQTLEGRAANRRIEFNIKTLR